MFVVVSNMIQIIPLYVFRWNWILIIIIALVAFVGISMAFQSTMNSFTRVGLLFVHSDIVHLIGLPFVLVFICVRHFILQITCRSQNPPH